MAAPTFVAAGDGAGSTTTATPTMPAGATTDDLLILHIEAKNGDGTTHSDPPTGGEWTGVGPTTAWSGVGGQAQNTKCSVYWAPYAAGINRVVPDAGDHTIARIYAFRGVDLTSPFDGTGSGTLDTAGTSHSCATGFSTSGADRLVVLAVTVGDDIDTTAHANTALTSVSQPVAEFASAAGQDGLVDIIIGTLASAGSAGTFTFTTSTSEEDAWIAFALKAPSGAVTQDLTGVLFTKAPTFFTGTVAVGAVALTGTLFTKPPTFPTGAVSQVGGAQNLTGTTFTKAPTFPQGSVVGVVPLTGVLFTKAPTFPTGTVTAGPIALTGVLFTKAATFPTGTVTAGPVALTGTLFTEAPTFPTGAAGVGPVALTGTLFTEAPSFLTGSVTVGAVALTGVLFAKAPTFPTGAVGQDGATQPLTGTLLTKAPTFPTGAVSVGPVALTGTTFTKAPTFPQGAVGQDGATQNLTGTTFTKAPTFPPGVVGVGPVALTGGLFTKAPIFGSGTVAAGVAALTGVLFQRAPTFPQGTVSQGGDTTPLTGTLFTKTTIFGTGTVTPGPVALTGITFIVGNVGVGIDSLIEGITHLLTDTVDILRFASTGPTPFGGDTGGWVVSTASTPARVELTSFGENLAGREANTQRRRVFLNPWVDVVDTDRVRWSGVDYPIEAIDQEWGRVAVHHLVVWLEETS